MKPQHTTAAILLVLLLMPIRSFCQELAQKDSADALLKSAARGIITDAGNCALISLNDKGLPMVRVMDAFAPEDDFTVWFGTNPKSRKVNQIRNNPAVTLYYADPDATGYVVIHGTALLVDDPKEKEKRWKPEWKAFYPDRDKGYMLIKVTPEWMEVLSYTRGLVGDAVTWQPDSVRLDSKK